MAVLLISGVSLLSYKGIQSVTAQEIDNTVFNLKYENKIWKFYAKDFEIDSNIFSIDARAGYLNRNTTKENKVKLLNKLIAINIEPKIAFNYIYLGFNKKLNIIAKNIEKQPQNAKISTLNGKINIKNEINGIKIDELNLYNNLINLYQTQHIINLNIPIIKTTPKVTKMSLQQYTYKRSQFSTSLASSSAGRKHNIRRAINSINGIKLGKRERFSFNEVVGRRTIKNGYREAKVILEGEFVEGVGGGVCQVSTTLYNAVLLAGLNVISSQKHSQRVGYVKAGFDAMVNYGTADLIFENNTEGDIYIVCLYTPDQITISIFGTSLKQVRYERESESVNFLPAGEQKVVYDSDGKYRDKVKYKDECFELKKAREGYTIKSYLVKYDGDELVSKQLIRQDKYPPQNSVIVYGTEIREDLCVEQNCGKVCENQ